MNSNGVIFPSRYTGSGIWFAGVVDLSDLSAATFYKKGMEAGLTFLAWKYSPAWKQKPLPMAYLTFTIDGFNGRSRSGARSSVNKDGISLHFYRREDSIINLDEDGALRVAADDCLAVERIIERRLGG